MKMLWVGKEFWGFIRGLAQAPWWTPRTPYPLKAWGHPFLEIIDPSLPLVTNTWKMITLCSELLIFFNRISPSYLFLKDLYKIKSVRRPSAPNVNRSWDWADIRRGGVFQVGDKLCQIIFQFWGTGFPEFSFLSFY